MNARMINATPSFGFFIGSWHKVFAWYPVRTYDNRLVWFKSVWRRRCHLKEHLQRTGDEAWWVYSLDEAAQ